MSNRCPKCGFETNPNMQACPSCHTILVENKKRRLPIKKIAIFVVVGFFGLSFLGLLLPDNKEKEQEVPWGIEELPEEENKEAANGENSSSSIVTTTTQATTRQESNVTISQIEVVGKLKNLKWNAKDIDILSNGNSKLAFKHFLSLSEEELDVLTENAQSISPSVIRQGHWKYLGDVVALSGEILLIENMAPNSDDALHMVGLKDTQLTSIQMDVGDEYTMYLLTTSEVDYNEGDSLNIVCVVIGYIETTNAFGGTITLPVYVSIW